ncbi:hypothetical protein CDD83_4409 [Cordyceps sp. RAO-2017]|nr:hypothetical protein CDD83_4409 [Cordyceps sp. RAO-2017]
MNAPSGIVSPASNGAGPVLAPMPAPLSLPAADPRPPERPASSQPVATMAAHRRIQDLNKQWEERRREGAAAASRGDLLDFDGSSGDSSDSSDMDEDSSSSDGDIVHVPAKAAPAASARQSPAPARATPKPLISTTPVPLPDFLRTATNGEAGVSFKASLEPEPATSTTAASQARKPATPTVSGAATATPSASAPAPGSPRADTAQDRRERALHFTTESALKRLREVRAEAGSQPRPAAAADMRFATPGELLARIRQSAGAPQGPRASSGNESEESRSSEGGAYEDEADEGDILMEDNPPLPSTETSKPESRNALVFTLDGRLYSVLNRTDAPNEPSRGAIIPTNYQLQPEPPRYICPVRDCRRLMKNMVGLGGHFNAKHSHSTFNDNRDGTLSLVSTYRNLGAFSPAIVVSQNPLPPDAPPPIEPQLPTLTAYSKRKEEVASPGLSTRSSATPALAPVVVSDIPPPMPAAPGDAASSDVCRYLHSFLPADQAVPRRRDDVLYMMGLPQRRTLPPMWISYHRGIALSVAFYASALAYLVGDEITGSKACKRKALSTSRLSDRCIALPSVMPEMAKRAFHRAPTCVGCFYRNCVTRQRNDCDWVKRSRAPSQSPAERADEAPAVGAPAPGSKTGSEQDDGPVALGQPLVALSSTREPRLKRSASNAEPGPGGVRAPKALRPLRKRE